MLSTSRLVSQCFPPAEGFTLLVVCVGLLQETLAATAALHGVMSRIKCWPLHQLNAIKGYFGYQVIVLMSKPTVDYFQICLALGNEAAESRV